jgi:hypothetical protein
LDEACKEILDKFKKQWKSRVKSKADGVAREQKKEEERARNNREMRRNLKGQYSKNFIVDSNEELEIEVVENEDEFQTEEWTT